METAALPRRRPANIRAPRRRSGRLLPRCVPLKSQPILQKTLIRNPRFLTHSSPLVHDRGCPRATRARRTRRRRCGACRARARPGVSPRRTGRVYAPRVRGRPARSHAGRGAAGPRGRRDGDAAACGAARRRGGYALFSADAMRIYAVLIRSVAGRGAGGILCPSRRDRQLSRACRGAHRFWRGGGY